MIRVVPTALKDMGYDLGEAALQSISEQQNRGNCRCAFYFSRMETYGLIGRTLKHSFSQKYFTQKFADMNFEGKYELFEMEAAREMLTLWESPTLRGLNVTIPYKADVIPLLDELSDDAAMIGAVNTIKLERNKLVGYNSDIYGFHGAMQEAWGENLSFAGALILGTGGASKAVDFVLRYWLKVPRIRFVSRHPREANHLAYSDLEKMDLAKYPLIVNTTPLGTYPNVEGLPDLPYSKIGASHYLYDLVYNPAETRFLKQGLKRGARVLNGYRMLVLQAEKSWEIWQK